MKFSFRILTASLFLLWINWFYGVATASQFVTEISMVGFNFAAAIALDSWARRSPNILKSPLHWLVLSTLTLSVGYILLVFWSAKILSDSSLSDKVSLFGAIFAVVGATLLPWRLEQAKMVPVQHALKGTVYALVGGGLLAFVLLAMQKATLISAAFLFASSVVAFLFAWNALVLSGGKLGRTLNSLNIGLVLIGFSRIVFILIPGINGFHAADFAFMCGVSLMIGLDWKNENLY